MHANYGVLSELWGMNVFLTGPRGWNDSFLLRAPVNSESAVITMKVRIFNDKCSFVKTFIDLHSRITLMMTFVTVFVNREVLYTTTVTLKFVIQMERVWGDPVSR